MPINSESRVEMAIELFPSARDQHPKGFNSLDLNAERDVPLPLTDVHELLLWYTASLDEKTRTESVVANRCAASLVKRQGLRDHRRGVEATLTALRDARNDGLIVNTPKSDGLNLLGSNSNTQRHGTRKSRLISLSPLGFQVAAESARLVMLDQDQYRRRKFAEEVFHGSLASLFTLLSTRQK